MEPQLRKLDLSAFRQHSNDYPWQRLFGRSQGRRIRQTQQSLLQEVLPQIQIDADLVATGNLNPVELFGAQGPARIEVEIGFGGGEHLATQAQRYPDRGFIGCEAFVNGITSLLQQIDQHQIKNVRVFPGDARLLLLALRPQSVQRVFVLFPDPWPKKRHAKRRLLNLPVIEHIHRILLPGGQLRLATDQAHYISWALEQVEAHGGFGQIDHNLVKLMTPPSDWAPTRYEQKALRSGGDCYYTDFIKQ